MTVSNGRKKPQLSHYPEFTGCCEKAMTHTFVKIEFYSHESRGAGGLHKQGYDEYYKYKLMAAIVSSHNVCPPKNVIKDFFLVDINFNFFILSSKNVSIF